ncbi:cytochrome P450, partial [Mycena maculata]
IGPGTAVILTDPAVVKELLDRRGVDIADRPPMHIDEIVSRGLNVALAGYGLGHWAYTSGKRNVGLTADAILTPQASARHLLIQQAEAIQLLHDILVCPESFYTHVQCYSSSVVLSVIHGKRTSRAETPETTAIFNYQNELERIFEPGATPPVDMIPILKLIPERWAKWKRERRRIRNIQCALYLGLLDGMRDRICNGEANGSYMEQVLLRQEELGLNGEMTAYLSRTLINAGSETTASYLHFLFLALLAYPDAQRKAHEEIDRVVGQHCMPTLDDLVRLPYICAMILEVHAADTHALVVDPTSIKTHRFRPVVRLLVPHAALASVEYQGYIIPKGATVFVNAWGIFHDPALYENLDQYLLTHNGTKPGVVCPDLRPNFVFGLGRRSCPGIHLAQNSININATNLVWAFDFTTELDDASNPIEGITTGPPPFRCRLTPCTLEKAKIISREFLEAGDIFAKFEFGFNAEDKEYLSQSLAHVH